MINFIEIMNAPPSYKIFFISESCATIELGNVMDEEINKRIIALFDHLLQQPLAGMIEAIPAYSSIAVYFDVRWLRKKIASQMKICEWIKNELHKLMGYVFKDVRTEKNLIRIPVCYDHEFAIDLPSLANQKNMEPHELVQLHASRQYRVYMLGFLPGFAYMGEVEERISAPRKPQPKQIVAGSVGIAGKQTGIYPLNSPGGWRIIGRTPVKMFDKSKPQPCLLKAGDYVEFYPITKDEFENYQSGSA